MLLCSQAGPVAAADSIRCLNGAWVDRTERCEHIVHFRLRNASTTDVRIAKAIGGGDAPVRNIGFVIGVSEYPNFSGGSLPAAHADVVRIENFLINQQHFDEVITLENSNATQEAIHYFLTQYIVTQGQSYNGRIRVLFAFSGHGVQDESGAALVLSNATSATSPTGLYRLRALQSDLQATAGASWQVLGLIDACYGGNIFSVGYQGGNPDAYWRPGAYVVTAGSKGNLTWTLGGSAGSVFFNAFLDGIEKNLANSYPLEETDPSDRSKVVNFGNVITMGQAFAEATRVIRGIQTGVIRSPIDPAQVSEPWVGSIEPDRPSPGAFFFLGKAGTGIPQPLAVVASVAPPAPRSWSGQPKNAKSLDQYPIRGIDVSHHDGKIDWAKVKASGIAFAYIKATQGEGFTDRLLGSNLANLHIAGMPFGIYVTYDSCADPDKQAEHLMKTVPAGADVLPVVLDIEWWLSSSNNPTMPSIMRCFDKEKPTVTVGKILRVLERLKSAYGKFPVLYVPSAAQKYFDERFRSYPIWVSDFARSSVARGSPKSPRWTIWQYSDRGRVDGVASPVDMNLFAGSARDFQAFKTGKLPGSNR